MNRSLNRSTTGRAGRFARFARAAVLCAALGGTAASVYEPVWAQGSARSQAWDLRRSNPAEAARQLEEVVRADPSDAKAFWFLAMVYNDMNRSADGLRALESARRADPSLGFASSPAAVERMQRALSNGGGGTSTSNPSSPSGSTQGGNTRTQGGQNGGAPINQQEILSALQKNGVYVSPGMADKADANALAEAVRSHPDGAKVLVMDTLPSGTNIGRFANKLHGALNMQKSLLVVATGSPASVAAYGGLFIDDAKELNAIVKANTATFTAQGYTQGIEGILRQHAAEEAAASRTGNIGLLLIVGIPAAGGVFLWKRAKKGKEEKLAQLQKESRAISNELAPQYEKLDSDFEFAIVGEADAEKQNTLREARAHAGESFSRAMKQLNTANDLPTFVAARSQLLYARDTFANARAVLEGKPLPQAAMAGAGALTQGGGGNYGGAGSMLPPAMQTGGMQTGNFNPNAGDLGPMGAGYPGAQPGYALDFFTSQPTPIAEMVPVELEVNGQRQRVWASRDSAQRALSGQPQVATVQYQGQQVPWYNAPQYYNPWNDFGSTMLQMMAVNMMMDSMFRPHHSFYHYHHYDTGYYGHDYHGGPSGYGGHSGHDSGNYGGGYDNTTAQVDNGGAGVANLDLFGNDASSYGNSGGYDNSGGGSLDLFGGGGGGGGWSSDSS